MIRTIKVELNAAFPNMPLAPFNVFHNSAAAVTVLNVPRRIVSLSLKVKNVSGAEQAFAAQRNGSSWGVVIPANFLAQSGTSTKGVKIIGVDDAANAFTLGAADLVVLLDDGTVTPVEEGGDMKHSEFSDLVAPDDMTQKESNALLKTIVNKLKGTAILLSYACCIPALAASAPLTPDTDHGDISPTNKLGEVVHAVVDGAARPLPPYLHALDFDDSYPDAAAEYYSQRGSGLPTASCSAVRSGGFLYRNFDYPFDDRAEFVVKMSAGPNRFASVGVAQVGTNLTEQMVTSGKPSRCYKWLPGATVDGINENGVVAEINVVDGPPQWRSGVPAALKIHPLAAVRWSLDNGTSAAMVASNLAARIAFPAGWTQNFHYMIADATSTYIVENGTAYQGGSGVSPLVMTNFRLYPTHSTGAGQERYDLLLSSACCITNAWYTNAYRRETNPPWFSEFGNNYEYLNAALNRWNDGRSKEQHRGESYTQTTYPFETITWWQTVHTSIYDITNKVLRVAVQEIDDWYTFQVPVSGGLKAETDPVWSAEKSGYQPKISDIDEIRAGASAGATAYQKPSGGIPKSDLAAGVQTSLGKADTALQSFEEQDPTVGLTNGTIHIKGQAITPITEHQDVSGFVPYTGAEQDVDLDERRINAWSVWSTLGFYCGNFSSGDFRGVFGGNEIYDDMLNPYHLPWSPSWGSDKSHAFALVSQIETATNGLAQTIPQKINAAVSANLNTYIDGDTGVEYVGKFYGGSLYYVPTGNVYPPNN